jgi:hypothetical protein
MGAQEDRRSRSRWTLRWRQREEMEELSAESMTNRSFGRFLLLAVTNKEQRRGKHILHNYAWHKEEGKSTSDFLYFRRMSHSSRSGIILNLCSHHKKDTQRHKYQEILLR